MSNTVHTAKEFINEHCCEKYSKPSKTNIKHSTPVRAFYTGQKYVSIKHLKK